MDTSRIDATRAPADPIDPALREALASPGEPRIQILVTLKTPSRTVAPLSASSTLGRGLAVFDWEISRLTPELLANGAQLLTTNFISNQIRIAIARDPFAVEALAQNELVSYLQLAPPKISLSETKAPQAA